jgi:serine/threonine protein kinase
MKIRSEFLNTSMKFTNFDDHFEKLDLIGQGGHGKIYRCRSRDEKDTNKYAVKDIDLNRLKLVPGFDKLKLRREVEILMTVEHPSIVYCHNAFESKSSHFLIVMDYCGGHDLVDILTERKAANQGFTELEAKAILRQLNSALVYLHANHIMHRDLKCDNVRILDTRTISKDFNDLKLIDFGYSKYTATSMASSWAGTPDYMAPEVDDVKSKRGANVSYICILPLLAADISDHCLGTSYDDSADCWSLGVILYMVLMMDFPRFESCDKKGFLLVKVIPSIWSK